MGWRSDVRDNYVVTLNDFALDNPMLVDQVYRSRPEAISDIRSLFVGTITEAITLDSGTWTRIVDVDILCALHQSDNEETSDNLEEMADTLIDWLAADDRAHCLGDNTEQHPTRSTTVELSEGAIFIPAIAITCRATIQQGRS